MARLAQKKFPFEIACGTRGSVMTTPLRENAIFLNFIIFSPCELSVNEVLQKFLYLT